MPALPDWPRRHRTRGSELHHKTARRDDDKAPHGGFGGPENAQHGAVEGLRKPRHRGFACKPQHGEKASTIPFSASLLRSIALAQSMVFPTQLTEHNRNI